MSTFKRAILYIARKRGKTALLLLIMFAVLSLIFTGISVNDAAKMTAAGIRESIGGYFKIATDYGKMEINQHVDTNVLEKVMEHDGVKGYNAMDITYLTVPDLRLKPARFTTEGDSKAQLTRFLANTDSSLHEYFLLDILRLEEGRHILPGDARKALVSSELMEMNGLKIGGILSATITEDVVSNGDMLGKTFEFEIVGVFRETSASDVGHSTPECDVPANFIFVDEFSGREIVNAVSGGKIDWYTSGVTFFVRDPQEIDSVVADVVGTEGLDWGSLKLTVNNAAYERSMEPLGRLEHMTGIIIFAMIGVGIVLLSLILTMWQRDRIHEAGVFMSVGIGKRSIYLQHLTECIVVFLAAFVLACAVSSVASRGMGAMLYHRAASSQPTQAQQEIYGPAAMQEPVALDGMEREPEFRVQTRPAVLLLTGGAGILLVVISVSISFGTIWKRHPKDLLTMME